MEKWLESMSVVCVKPYLNYRVGGIYRIKGRGNLEFNADSEVGKRKGWGVCVEDEWHGSYDEFGELIKDWWKKPYKDRIKWYYLDLNELNSYFITDDENYELYKQKELRDSKLNQLGL
jgi:hypothetical protein